MPRPSGRGLYLEQAKAANNKTFAVLAKVSLATALSLPARPGIAPVLTAVL